jgi:hypothetical protein
MGLNQQALRAKLSLLLLAGLARPEVDAWIETWPSIRNDFAADSEACSSFWSSAAALRARLPTKPARNTDQSTAAALIHRAERDLRDLFLNSHAEVLYDNLTASRERSFFASMSLSRGRPMPFTGWSPTRMPWQSNGRSY